MDSNPYAGQQREGCYLSGQVLDSQDVMLSKREHDSYIPAPDPTPGRTN